MTGGIIADIGRPLKILLGDFAAKVRIEYFSNQ
jgi:hypothetical protein